MARESREAPGPPPPASLNRFASADVEQVCPRTLEVEGKSFRQREGRFLCQFA